MAGGAFAASFSTDRSVVTATLVYVPWAVILPVIGVTSFVYDGIFIGATWTRAMLVTMVASFAVYGALLLVTGALGNHGLWLAFTIFFVVRAAGQALMLPRLRVATFAGSTGSSR
jgi:MATE family multidrug resistance protein